MEANIVVLLDYDAQNIRFYGEVNKTVPFDDAFLLPYLIKGKSVLYITNGNEVDGDEIISLVEQLTIPKDNPEKRYIHVTGDEHTYTKVPDVGLTFAGPRDVRPLDKLGNVFERSAKMRELLIQGKVEVITESVAKQLRKDLPHKNLRDKALDEVLLNKSVDEFQNEESDMWADDNEITSENAVKIESEADAIIRKYGIK